jgi:hypothetical protein
MAQPIIEAAALLANVISPDRLRAHTPSPRLDVMAARRCFWRSLLL